MDREKYNKCLSELDIPCDKLDLLWFILDYQYEKGRKSMLRDLIKAKENIPDHG